MKMHLAPRLLALACLCAAPAAATTWVAADIDDPLAPGRKCEGQQPASWGSYIYHWPSKWDQVFWPHVDPEGVWTCPASGLVAFMGDLELTDAEKAKLRAYLDALPERSVRSRAGQLARLEAVYALREKDEEFRILLLRVLAYAHEELGDAAAAAKYRADAMARMRTALAGTLDASTRAEYLFVAAAYAREAGDAAQSDRDLAALAAHLPTLQGDAAGYGEYLGELLEDVRRIEPGGALAPAESPR
jgi:hypothetical protein